MCVVKSVYVHKGAVHLEYETWNGYEELGQFAFPYCDDCNQEFTNVEFDSGREPFEVYGRWTCDSCNRIVLETYDCRSA